MGTEVQACGGTHCRNSGEVGIIKILRIEHIQDGVERIEFSAGFAAIYAMQHLQDIVNQAAATLSVQVEHLPQSVERFFLEWKERGKSIEDLEERLADLSLQSMTGEDIGGVSVIIRQIDRTQKELVNMASGIANQKGVAVFISTSDGIRVVAGSGNDSVDAGVIVRELCTLLGGKGGGKPGLAQGAGKDADAIPGTLDRALSLIHI